MNDEQGFLDVGGDGNDQSSQICVLTCT